MEVEGVKVKKVTLIYLSERKDGLSPKFHRLRKGQGDRVMTIERDTPFIVQGMEGAETGVPRETGVGGEKVKHNRAAVKIEVEVRTEHGDVTEARAGAEGEEVDLIIEAVIVVGAPVTADSEVAAEAGAAGTTTVDRGVQLSGSMITKMVASTVAG